jgi:flagellin
MPAKFERISKMISIQTNVNSLVAQQNLSVNSNFQSKTIQQLTSGYRINQSGDDAAGLAVANKFRSTVAELTQGVANGNDATAQLQIMDGGMNNISLILDRLKTLATQSASGTFTGNRTVLNDEFQNALSEVDRQAQSIGLNTGGLFAKNLDVFLGAGSGSSSLQNGIVTLGLTQSAVDSQSLGMRGMLAVNLTSGTLSGINAGTDIGSTSATSVQNILSNVAGPNLNQQAVAGYAAMQFSGAGFSDAGKVSISVNLAGVTDVATLATAVNSAIQSAGNGTTASTTAFKNANIVASLHTDSSGGQQLAFSSGTAAFQVQAGDQMANALLGNVATVGGVAKGTAISGTTATTVTGAVTKAGNFAAAQTVKLVVTGGGLAGPVTLTVNTTSQVSSTGAITDLENQFRGSAALQAAGLSMSGASTVGSTLAFNSANGQGFNIQVTGDAANLLGLGSFLADSNGNADYTKITAGAAYDNTAVTGSGKTTGLAAGLEISLNGLGSSALTPVDFTAGAHAVAASTTSTAGIAGSAPGNGPGKVDITALNQNLDITVTNNGVATNAYINLSTSTVATKGAAISTVTGAHDFAGSPVIVSAAALNNSFMVAVDGGTATKITLADGTYATAGDFLTEVNAQLTSAFAGGVVASYADSVAPGDALGALTLTSAHVAGVDSSVSVAAATTATSGKQVSTVTSVNIVSSPITVSAAAHNNEFSVAVDGGAAVTVTIADGTYNSAATSGAGSYLEAVNNAVSGKGLAATWNATTNALTLTSSGAAGAGSSVLIGAVTDATRAAVTSSVTSATIVSSPLTVSAALHNNKFTVAVDGGAAVTVTVADDTYNSAATSGAGSLLAAINAQVGALGLTASWAATTNALTLTRSAGTPGAGSSILIGAATDATFADAVSTVTSANIVTSPVTVSAAAHNNEFTIINDGGATQTVTVGDGTYSTAVDFLAAVNTALSGKGLTASWDANNSDKLTLTRNAGTAGAGSSVSIGQATYTTAAANTSALTDTAGAPSASLTIGAGNDQLTLAVDGGPSVTLTLADATYTNAGDKATFLLDLNDKIAAGGADIAGKVTATWATGGVLTLTSVSTNGVSSTVNVSVSASNDASLDLGFTAGTASGSTQTNTGMGNVGLSAGLTSGDAAFANTGMGAVGLSAGLSSGDAAFANTGWSHAGLTKDVVNSGSAAATNTGLGTLGLTTGFHGGVADGPATAASIADQIQTQLGGSSNALVTVSNDYKISIASATKGANSSVVVNATANSAYAALNLNVGAGQVLGQNSSIADIVDNLNAQFAASSTYQAAGLTAAATLGDGTGSGSFITIQSNNSTQFRLDSLGAAAVATAGALSSTVTANSISATSSIIVGAGSGQFKVAVDGGSAITLTVANATYTSGGAFLAAVQAAISGSALTGLVTAAFDTATRKLTLTSATTGTASSVTTSVEGTNTGLSNLGFGTGATNSGQLFSHTENTGFGVAGTTFVGAAASSTGTAMSAMDAFGVTNSASFTFSAMKFGNDKQAITFSATDANGVLETRTVTLQNDKSINRAGVSIDDAVAYINTQLQQSTSQPALQQIVAVKENVSGAEKINFVSSLSGFTVSVAATANADGLNGGVATYRTSVANGDGANMQVDTKEAAKAAVTALAAAVGKLGSAQAAVGKGQNQLYYAVNLAQSQITNFSAAESYLRDANVAQQAANLTKAQVLSQASIAAMAQANSAPQAVLALLRG